MSVAKANGIDIAYELSGPDDGIPLLLIMGLGMQLVDWPDSFCQMLVEKGYRLIRFDNRDSGLSKKLNHLGTPNLALGYAKYLLHLPLHAPYTLNDMADDAIGLLDALGIERLHVAGVSMGGMIAQLMAGRYPQRVTSLTSIMSSSGRRGLPMPSSRVRNAMMARPDNPRDMNAVLDHYVQLFRLIGSPAYPIPEPELRQRISRGIKRSVSLAGTARQIYAITASGDRVAMLRSLRVPTQVIHGRDDLLVPIAAGRDVAHLVPGAQLHEIAGMGHDLPPQLDAQLTELIDAHCRAAEP